MEATCSIRQLIERLKEFDENLPVYLRDPDTDWIMPIGIINGQDEKIFYKPVSIPCVLITSQYQGYPDGSDFYEHSEETD